MTSPALTDLESRLASRESDVVRGELAARLHALACRLRADMAKGLSRDDYGVWSAAVDAALAAQEVLERHPAATRSTSSGPALVPFSIPPHLR